MPWYLKVVAYLGGVAFVWKLLQGKVPAMVEAAKPFAVRAADFLVGFIQAQPLLRWLILGSNEAQAKATFDAVVDGLQAILEVFQNRVDADMDAAAPPQSQPPAAS